MNTSSAVEAKTGDIRRGTHPNSSTKPLVKIPGRTSRQPEQAGPSKPFDMKTVKCYNCSLLGHMSKDCRKPRVAHRNMEPDIPQEDPQALTEGNDTGGELEYYDEPDPDVVDDQSVSSGEEQDFDDGSDYGLENNEPATENQALRVGVESSCPMSAGEIRELVVIHFKNRLRSRLTWISMIDGYMGPEVTPVIDRYTEDLDIHRSRGNRTLTWNEVFPEMYQHDSPIGIDGLQYWDDGNMEPAEFEDGRWTPPLRMVDLEPPQEVGTSAQVSRYRFGDRADGYWDCSKEEMSRQHK
ncbi:hypothetical protein C8J56DRAFT_879606 [Mycena floridula]|nr:hypothetical protein C8J56DRAFT_879606 [Mycena floridula]